MLTHNELIEIIESQHITFQAKASKVNREALSTVKVLPSFATIITGLRRCGKSTLMLQLMNSQEEQILYLNFEDIRLVDFDQRDFIRLLQVIDEMGAKKLYFDEIQLLEKWEIFVHQLLNEEYQVFITGSNASLLSKELGTHLTGRHLSYELMPFSFSEFLAYNNESPTCVQLKKYAKIGGMPEYVKHQEPQILLNLVNDILYRDIAVRHSLRDIETLKKLTIYLLTNIGKLVSANKLTDTFGLKSTTTILDYFGFLSNSYVVEFMPMFSYSLKVQNRNPKKVYSLDNGIATIISLSFSEDHGRKLENLVYQHLRRQGKELSYFKGKKECDFVVRSNNQSIELIQVCYELTIDKKDREINGLVEAMEFFELTEGTIVTFDQQEEFHLNDKVIKVIPAHVFLANYLL
jgi:predicted AAA+ superfamily ATPase